MGAVSQWLERQCVEGGSRAEARWDEGGVHSKESAIREVTVGRSESVGGEQCVARASRSEAQWGEEGSTARSRLVERCAKIQVLTVGVKCAARISL